MFYRLQNLRIFPLQKDAEKAMRMTTRQTLIDIWRYVFHILWGFRGISFQTSKKQSVLCCARPDIGLFNWAYMTCCCELGSYRVRMDSRNWTNQKGVREIQIDCRPLWIFLIQTDVKWRELIRVLRLNVEIEPTRDERNEMKERK